MNKRGLFTGIVVLIILAVSGFFLFTSTNKLDNGLKENQTIKDSLENKLENYMEESCIPATCCHATTCVNENLAPDCSEIMCTMECVPETMDCGQGSCKWENGNCEVEWNE
ncbi:hypothetical protein KAS08_03970 [Candidatus Pacearchaeota archaeon]|nr:hypothetical protein [Candidatus Pacearchaeota archaeon]